MSKSFLKGLIIFGVISLLPIYEKPLIAMNPDDEIPPTSFFFITVKLATVDFPEAPQVEKPPIQPSPQLTIDKLPNKFDTLKHKDNNNMESLYKWLRERDKRFDRYKDAHREFTRKQTTFDKAEDLFKTLPQPDKLELVGFNVYTKEEEARDATKMSLSKKEKFDKVCKEFIGPQGLFRTLRTISELEDLIVESHFKPRNIFKQSKTQHAYQTPPQKLVGIDRVDGFTFSPFEVEHICIPMLKKVNS